MFQSKRILPKGHKSLIRAWTFYDWANSVYSLIISSSIFPLFFGALFITENKDIILFDYPINKTAVISLITSIAFFTITLVTPILSGIADYLGNKKVFMRFFIYLGSFSCMGLYWFNLESIYISLSFYFLGVIGFWMSWGVYNSYLPDIAHTHQQDRVSAVGFSIGFLGSVILLIICLTVVMNPSWAGINEATPEASSILAMRYCFIATGLWWLLFSQYSLYYLPKGNNRNNKITYQILFNGFKEYKTTFKQIVHYKLLKNYLLAFFIFNSALQTVMIIAAYFGESEISWPSSKEKTAGLITCIMLIQLVAIAGSMGTVKLSKRIGNIPTLIIINILFALVCLFSYFVHTPTEFYITSIFVGMIMGGGQALSRSTYSKYLPETEDTTSFFSFYEITSIVSIIIGTLIFGIINQLSGNMRFPILFLISFFIIGVLLLFRVLSKEKRMKKTETI